MLIDRRTDEQVRPQHNVFILCILCKERIKMKVLCMCLLCEPLVVI
jgi:hypothetical protein